MMYHLLFLKKSNLINFIKNFFKKLDQRKPQNQLKKAQLKKKLQIKKKQLKISTQKMEEVKINLFIKYF